MRFSAITIRTLRTYGLVSEAISRKFLDTVGSAFVTLTGDDVAVETRRCQVSLRRRLMTETRRRHSHTSCRFISLIRRSYELPTVDNESAQRACATARNGSQRGLKVEAMLD